MNKLKSPLPRHHSHKTVNASIVVVAKAPIPGISKTRLIPLTGAEGCAKLATAMLSDVLTTLSTAAFASSNNHTAHGSPSPIAVDRILLYAPPTTKGKQQMQNLCQVHKIPLQEPHGVWKPNAWTLLPMSNQRSRQTKRHKMDLTSSQLSDVLENALQRARQRQRSPGPVIFLGMDAPQVPLDEIAHALGHPDQARLCPAADGGYGMLSVPATDGLDNSVSVFDGVRWSDPLTAVSQIKALTDQTIPVTLGRLMHDVDEPQDVLELVDRLQLLEQKQDGNDKQEDNAEEDLLSPKSTVSGKSLFSTKSHKSFFSTKSQKSTSSQKSAVSRRSTTPRNHNNNASDSDNDVLLRPPGQIQIPKQSTCCAWTRQALLELGLWEMNYKQPVAVSEIVSVERELLSGGTLPEETYNLEESIPFEREISKYSL